MARNPRIHKNKCMYTNISGKKIFELFVDTVFSIKKFFESRYPF